MARKWWGMTYYPAFLNLKARRVLLFGGGEVALRKARTLIRSGADLTAVSRSFSRSFLRFSSRNRIKVRYAGKVPKTFHGASLVIAATSDHTFNREISRRCGREGILVNVVDDPAHSTFIVPSLLKRGSLQIAISTGGASPLLAKTLRKKLAKQFGPEYSGLIKQLERDRRIAKRVIHLGRERRSHFQKLVGSRLRVLESKNSKVSLRGAPKGRRRPAHLRRHSIGIH